MKVTRIKILEFRNLHDVDMQIEPDAPLVCLVGENGTGKSAILTLLSAAAHSLGISAGLYPQRDVFSEPCKVEIDVTVSLDAPTLENVFSGAGMQQSIDTNSSEWLQAKETWRGQLKLVAGNFPVGPMVFAKGVADNLSRSIADFAVSNLRSRQETQHLFLDADRSFIGSSAQGEHHSLVAQDWNDPTVTMNYAFQDSRTLYTSWLQYLYAREHADGANFQKAMRAARDTGGVEPEWADWMAEYREMLSSILPHLRLAGMGDPQSGHNAQTPIFESAGAKLDFSRLSSGEREIAFLVGQIERFKLKRGLFLLDEPELHLNPDLLRSWLQFVRDTITDGQMWIATHSIEAAEVATPESTFVLERNSATGAVSVKRPVASRPVLLQLSAALGSPAFAIHKRRFVYIEGENRGVERQRFYDLIGDAKTNRFIEGGGCRDILRTLAAMKLLALETDEQLRVGGVIDRDFRTDAEAKKLETDNGVHVLGCHEIENLYLQPDAVSKLLARQGRSQDDPIVVIRDSTDQVAGLWVVQRALALIPGSTKPANVGPTWAIVKYPQLISDWNALKTASVATVGTAFPDWEAHLVTAHAELNQKRQAPDWWRYCFGKQAIKAVMQNLGLNSVSAFQRSVHTLWADGDVAVPDDLRNLRSYVSSLSL